MQVGSRTVSLDPRPTSKRDVRVAVLCAVGSEGISVGSMFDVAWKREDLPTIEWGNDMKLGRMGHHFVVQFWMGEMGKGPAGVAAERIRNSFPDIEILLIIGVCGAVPYYEDGKIEKKVSLGDVIISKGLVFYDAGKTMGRIWYPRVSFVEPSSSRFGGFIKRLEHDKEGNRELKQTSLKLLQLEVQKRQLKEYETIRPNIYFGYMASGDQVIKKARRRNRIVEASRQKPIGFEMDAAGVTSLYADRVFVIKGVCDYADERRDKTSQVYAGLASAVFMRAFLDEWRPEGLQSPAQPQPSPSLQTPEPLQPSPAPKISEQLQPSPSAGIPEKLLPSLSPELPEQPQHRPFPEIPEQPQPSPSPRTLELLQHSSSLENVGANDENERRNSQETKDVDLVDRAETSGAPAPSHPTEASQSITQNHWINPPIDLDNLSSSQEPAVSPQGHVQIDKSSLPTQSLDRNPIEVEVAEASPSSDDVVVDNLYPRLNESPESQDTKSHFSNEGDEKSFRQPPAASSNEFRLPFNAQSTTTARLVSGMISSVFPLRINFGDDLELKSKDGLPYQLIRNLGVGGNASVEEVQDQITGSVYARKMLRNIYARNVKEAKEAFHNEVQVIRRLAPHHHIIQVFATYIVKRELGLILSPVADRGDLSAFLQEFKDNEILDRLHPDYQILEKAFGCLASGLKFIHGQRIRHKDIKPQNILIHQGSILYTDFGLALDFCEGNSTTMGALRGLTKRYCAPEVESQGRRNSKSDIFSLGCVYIEILAALHPDKLPDDLLQANFFVTAADASFLASNHLPDESKYDFFKTMLAVDPKDRPSAAGLVHELLENSRYQFCRHCTDPRKAEEVRLSRHDIGSSLSAATQNPLSDYSGFK